MGGSHIKSVAVIGAGASGAAAAAALAAEAYFDTIRVFERRECSGGTWIYDGDPGPPRDLHPGALPPDVDPPLEIPSKLPRTVPPSSQQRWDKTPIYAELTTNVPAIAMSFDDKPFPYGPFVPHWIPKQYIENYFSWHKTDSCLVLNTTVEDVTQIENDRWKLTFRKYDAARHLDEWWEEHFDAVIIANGHYAVPFIPPVKGLPEYLSQYPGRVEHSKVYRVPSAYANKRVLIIGNSASGQDVTTQLVQSGQAKCPIYQSRRSKSRWDGDRPPQGIVWKPIITEYKQDGTIVFADNTILSDVDVVIYCTGYKPSFPFWNEEKNGGPLYDYAADKLVSNYQHTFFPNFPTLGLIGMPRVLTFRSFEYQAIALARLFSGRAARSLPPVEEQKRWEKERVRLVRKERRKFHQIEWADGETMEWLRFLFETAGLPELEGLGRCPPVLGRETRWAIEHIRKYPEPGKDENGEEPERGWVIVEKEGPKDILHFI